MVSPFLGELLGTMTLIVLGDGVVAGVLVTGGTPVLQRKSCRRARNSKADPRTPCGGPQ